MANPIVIPLLLLVLGGILTYLVFGTESFKRKGGARTLVMIAGIGLLAYGGLGVAGVQGWVDLGSSSPYFFTAVGVAPTQIPTVPSIPTIEGLKQRIISTLKISSVKEKYSNAYNTVDGTLKVYDKDTDPRSATANPIDTITITNGAGSTTNAKIKTNTPYRVTFAGASTYYDLDYGVIVFADENFNPSTGEYGFDMGTIAKVTTIDDLINETAVSTAELIGNDTENSFTYDESDGDGQFYLEPTISFSGANTEIKNPVMCIEWDTSLPPEGNELSAFTYQLTSGTDFGIPSDLLNYWSTESCVSLGAMQTGGVSSKIKLTLTVDETALDNNADIWYLGIDDLGSLRGKDVSLATGATLQRIKFDSQA